MCVGTKRAHTAQCGLSGAPGAHEAASGWCAKKQRVCASSAASTGSECMRPMSVARARLISPRRHAGRSGSHTRRPAGDRVACRGSTTCGFAFEATANVAVVFWSSREPHVCELVISGAANIHWKCNEKQVAIVKARCKVFKAHVGREAAVCAHGTSECPDKVRGVVDKQHAQLLRHCVSGSVWRTLRDAFGGDTCRRETHEHPCPEHQVRHPLVLHTTQG